MIRIIIAILLFATPALALPSVLGTITGTKWTGNSTCAANDITHTVDSGTDILLVIIWMRGAESVDQDIDGVRWDTAGVNEGFDGSQMTAETFNSGSNNDGRLEVWALTSPTAGASKNINVNCASTHADGILTAMNIQNVETTGTSYRLGPNTSNNTGQGTNNCTLASDGDAGNLIVGFIVVINESKTVVENSGWATVDEVCSDDCLGGASDILSLVSTDEGPNNLTYSWTDNAENACLIIEFCDDPDGCAASGRRRAHVIGA